MAFRPSGTFRAFQYREFRLLWLGAFTSSIGTWMQKLAQSWLILTVTGSPFWLGVDAFLADAPFLLFSPLGGVLADRFERRRILFVSQLVQMSAAFTLMTLLLAEKVTVPAILALSFVTGCAQSFGAPAYQALVPTLVDRKDIPNAVSLNATQFNLARIVGPVLAGFAFHYLGSAACMGLNGLSFLAVVASLLALEARPPAGPSGERVLDSLRSGVQAVASHPGLRGVVGLAFVGSFCAMPVTTFLPVFARDVFRSDEQRYAVLLAVFGAGAVAGALGLAGVTAQVRRKGLVGVATLMAFGLTTAAFAVSRVPALSYVLLALSGALVMVVFASFMTLVQTHVPDDLRGRVVSLYGLAFRGAMPLGNITAGTATRWLPAPAVLAVNGLVVAAVAGFVLLRRSRAGVVSLVDDGAGGR